ncbi:MAG: efflux RND transporter permease subunit [Candidatus Woesearchaeota archaeon]
MIDVVAEKLGRAQAKKPFVFVAAFITLILLTAPGIFLLIGNVEASLENVLPSNVESVATMNDARTQYSADMLHVVLYAQDGLVDVREAQSFAYEIASRLENSPQIVSVQATLDESRVNHDYTLAVIDVQADTGTSTEKISLAIQTINQAIESSQPSNPGVRAEITGFAAIDQATFQTIMSDFLVITGVAMAFILLVVFSLFRSIRYTLIPMASVMVALIATMGVTGYLSITITVVTMVAAAMILGLGIDFGIHIIHSYNEYRRTRKPANAMKRTVQELFRAQLGASLTTSAGFLALALGVLPAMANLGLVLAIGIMFTFLASTMLLPPLLLLTENSQ